jgi:hypothetical protein
MRKEVKDKDESLKLQAIWDFEVTYHSHQSGLCNSASTQVTAFFRVISNILQFFMDITVKLK